MPRHHVETSRRDVSTIDWVGIADGSATSRMIAQSIV